MPKPSAAPIGSKPAKGRIDLNALANAKPVKRRRGSKAARPKTPPIRGGPDIIRPGDPWFVDPSHFPAKGPLEDRLRFCLRYAVLAPSSHNSQPWRFLVSGPEVRLYADRARALPVVDPDDRELTISCGCALEHLRLALNRFGVSEQTEILPDPDHPDLLAVVRAQPTPASTSGEIHAMVDAMALRRTNRRKYDPRLPPDRLLDTLATHAKSRGADLVYVFEPRARMLLAELIAEADRVQFASRQFRRELAAWMHHNRSASKDGLPGYTQGLHELTSVLAPLAVRTFDLGRGRAARDHELAEHSPVLAVLGSDHDAPADWIRTGQALAAVLLRGTVDGLSASYLNQPVEVPELRPRVRRVTPQVYCPQVILRMGYGPSTHRTPRRPVEDVLMPMGM